MPKLQHTNPNHKPIIPPNTNQKTLLETSTIQNTNETKMVSPILSPTNQKDNHMKNNIIQQLKRSAEKLAHADRTHPSNAYDLIDDLIYCITTIANETMTDTPEPMTDTPEPTQDQYFKPLETKQWTTIDWDKIKTIEDIKTILKHADIRLNPHHPHFNSIKHLTK